jgi:prepilin-type N-terminal cleavage/methylation domain-containing protein
MKKTTRFGFSLIELSAVILIIGILVIGITKGSRILSESRLKSARSLTINSPVNSTKNLVLWLDTASEKSFDTSIENNSLVANWYDLNTQTSSKNNATQSNEDNKPSYITNAVNGLPALRFDGSTDFMNFNGENLNKSAYTVILVEQRKTSNAGFIFGVDGRSRTVGFAIGYASNTLICDYHYWGAYSCISKTVPAYSGAKTNIISSVYGHAGNASKICINFNGGVASCGSSVEQPGYTTDFKIGRADFANYSGYIVEVIAFDRALKDTERLEIEKYLGQKWGIKVS